PSPSTSNQACRSRRAGWRPAWPWPWSSPAGTRPCSTTPSSGRWSGPTAPGRSCPIPVSSLTRARVAPTPTSTSAGTTATSAACRAVIVVADRLAEQYAPGGSLALDVHVVNDTRKAVRGQVHAALAWTGGSQTWTWEGEVPEDDCVRVGTVQAVVPHAPGPLT